MKVNCIIKRIVDDDSVEIEIDGISLLCFANFGTIFEEGEFVYAELSFFDDIEIKESDKEYYYVKKGDDFFSYIINGLLDIEKKCVSSLIDFELEKDCLYDFGYLDKKYVEIFVPRINVSFDLI